MRLVCKPWRPDPPLPGARGVWQYISLPRGTELEARGRTAGTFRTGYCEAKGGNALAEERRLKIPFKRYQQ